MKKGQRASYFGKACISKNGGVFPSDAPQPTCPFAPIGPSDHEKTSPKIFLENGMNTKSSKLNSYMRLLSYLKPYWKLLLVSVLFMLLVSGSNLVVPWIIKDVIDKVLNDKDLAMLYLI